MSAKAPTASPLKSYIFCSSSFSSTFTASLHVGHVGIDGQRLAESLERAPLIALVAPDHAEPRKRSEMPRFE